MPININTYCRINRNGSININTDPTFPKPSSYPNFACVSGAGSAEVNGTYTKIDVYRYESPNFQITGIRLVNVFGLWQILYGGSGDEVSYYNGNTNPAPEYPWQEISWVVGDIGQFPVPVVTIGPC